MIDNGEGIPKDLADSIFYPLVSGKEQGSGLGLSLVQTFVEQHGAGFRSAVKPAVPISAYCFPYRYEKCLDRGR